MFIKLEERVIYAYDDAVSFSRSEINKGARLYSKEPVDIL